MATPKVSFATIYPSLFRMFLSCTEKKNLAWGSALHAYTLKYGSLADVFLSNSIVVMYAKCGQLHCAFAAFEDMGSNKDVVSWNSLINAYSQIGSHGSHFVFQLFGRMRAEGGVHVLPNCFTFVGVFTAASCSPETSGYGREAHCVAIKTANSDDVFVGSYLLNMYCKLGCTS